jgi:predicted enzyme related to lactoylglutathione lyase
LPEQAKRMGAPPHWTSNVRVADVDATVAQAKKPLPVPGGARIAQLTDPQGAAFALHEPAKSA